MAQVAASTENSEARTAPMVERVRLFDWSRTSLGPLSDWPLLLRSMVSLVLNARVPMCLAWGDSLVSFCNDAYRPLLGNTPDEFGRPFPEVCAQAWAAIGPIVGRARAGEASSVEDLPLVLERHGYPEHTWWTFSCSPVSDETGRVGGVLCVGHETTREVESRANVHAQRKQPVGQDVTDVIKVEAALREREERLRFALDAGRMAVFDVDAVAGVIAASPELNRMLGFPPEASPSLDEVRAQFYPGELDRLRRVTGEAHERGETLFENEHRHIRADNGEVRWLLIRSISTFAEDGAVLGTVGVIMDVTERKEAEERLKLLALEVDHRANNLLATVQSMVTLTRAEDIPGFRESVLGRISALAHSHRLLAESRWTAAGLARVVEEELRAFMAGSQVRVEGPDANLAPAVAQGLAMALHELATNAAKHGALSRCDGRIDVSWTAPIDAGCVRMTWLEREGPPVSPPTRAGFGTNLLRRALAGAVGGSVELEWQAEGVCCRLHIPVL